MESLSSSKHTKLSKWSKPLPSGKFLCTLCPRACELKPGQRGFCFVRRGTEQGVELASYGRSSGYCIDPIEKKPLNHFYPGTSVLSFGTVGCNLACKFCQNWDISKARKDERLQSNASPREIAAVAKSYGCRSVAFTYNDPVVFAEYAIDTALACHEQDIKAVAVTAGYITDVAREAFFAPMDAANVDLKAFDESFYKKLSLAELGPVLDTLKFLKQETNVWFEITTLLIPGQNDSEKEVTAMCEWILENLGPEVPLHFTAFHPDFRMRDLGPTPTRTLTGARKIALKTGLSFVYTGNVHDPSGASTYCPECGDMLVERNWYELGAFHVRDGCCEKCGARVAGRFENVPGTWGAKRLPIQMGSSIN